MYMSKDVWSEPILNEGKVKIHFGDTAVVVSAAAAEDLAHSLDRHANQARQDVRVSK
jgi:hypothetical protein